MSSIKPSYTLQAVNITIPGLRLVQNVSAASFSVFSILHLASPLSALLPSRPQYLSSAENRASGVQLLAREVYQTAWGEPVLVWGSLGAHVLSGVALRWLGVLQRVERRKLKREEVKLRARELAAVPGDQLPRRRAGELEKNLAVDEVEELEAELVATTAADEELVVPAVAAPSPSIFQVPNFHQKTGYLLIPFLAHHAYVHRLLPSSPFPPISSLSPSFFSYSFTALSLNHDSLYLRCASAATYAGVTLLATYHGLVGWRILLDPTSPRSLKPRRKRAGEKDSVLGRALRRGWQASWIVLVSSVGVGAARIAGYLGGERTVKIPEFVARRMDLVLRKGFALA
ncbi:hypothetical protein JCM10207_007360 [Rhodosporidiobolus poonsookiae]